MSAKPNSSLANRLLPFIGFTKLVKAVVLYGASYALRYLRHQSDITQTLKDWADAIHVDPDGTHLHKLIEHATTVDLRHMHFAAIALFVYASLFTMEGVGLILRKRWGEYLTVVITSLLLPLEIYELAHPGRRVIKVFVLLFNLAVVAYLIWNLYKTRETHGDRPAKAEPAEASAG